MDNGRRVPAPDESKLLSVREAYTELGRALFACQRPAEAITAFEQALEERGESPGAHDILLDLALSCESAGNGEAAVRAYLRAAATQPEQVQNALSRATEILTREISAAIMPWLEDEWWPAMNRVALSASQRFPAVQFLRTASVTAEDHAREVKWLKEAATLAGEDAALADAAGAMLYEAGGNFLDRDVKAAVEVLRSANAVRPDHMAAYWTLLDALRFKSATAETSDESQKDLKESIEVWQSGIARRWPNEEDSWAYLARADVNERLALNLHQDRWALGWEALCYCERAAILEPAKAANYAYIARWCRFLGLEACEYEATAEALEVNAEDNTALEERIICLANSGRFEELAPVLAKRRETGQSAWTDAIEAFMKVRQEDAEGALSAIHKAIDELPYLIWCREVRAECYRHLDRRADAETDYQSILEGYDPESGEDQSSYGTAAFRLGVRKRNIDRAIEIFNRIAENGPLPTDDTSPIYLGLCYLVKGDLERGQELFSDRIKRCRNWCDLDDLVRVDLAEIEKASEKWPDGAALRGILNRDGDGIKALVRAQIAMVNENESAEPRLMAAEELQQMLHDRPESDAGSWLRVAALAGLARIRTRDEEWLDAADLYRQLLHSETGRFPEARHGLMRLSESAEEAGNGGFGQGQFVEGERHLSAALRIEGDLGRPTRQAEIHQSLGDWFSKAGKFSQALEQYRQELDAVRRASLDKGFVGGAHARIGYAQLKLGNRDEANTRLSAALELYGASDDGAPGERLGSCLRSLISGFAEFWELDDALSALPEEISANSGLRGEVARYLDGFDAPASPDALLPIVTPVVLEISDDLVAFVDSRRDGGKFLYDLIPKMRDRIQDGTGVNMPGVRARANPQLPSGAYELQLDEVPASRGLAVLDRWYFPGSPAELDGLGVEGHVVSAEHPVTGDPGIWLDEEGHAAVERAHKASWSTAEFLIDHIEALLRRNLACFAGVQETANMLQDFEQLSGGKELVDAALPTPFARRRFTWLLKSLVDEQVPISDLRTILETVKDFDAAAASILAMLRAVRLRLLCSPPGYAAGRSRVPLPARFEEQLLGVAGGYAFLAADPIQKLEFLVWLRQEMQQHDSQTVLVTRSPELRPLLRRLVTPEFPELMVLAEDELRSIDKKSIEHNSGEANANESLNTYA